MTQVIIAVRCGPPLATWYTLFASGTEDPIIFAEATMLQMKKYNPSESKLWETFPCNDSVRVRDLAIKKLRELHKPWDENAPDVKWKGSWFDAGIVKIRKAIGEAIAEIV